MGINFRLASMSPLIRGLTMIMLALPVAFLAGALLLVRALAIPALLIVAVYAWIWLRFRPGRFVLDRDRLRIHWPLKRRDIARGDIVAARLLDARQLREEIGWGMRIGAGGLWGAFGLLWTRRRGLVQMYVSRTDGYVWIECAGARPWLITPERPGAFVKALEPDN